MPETSRFRFVGRKSTRRVPRRGVAAPLAALLLAGGLAALAPQAHAAGPGMLCPAEATPASTSAIWPGDAALRARAAAIEEALAQGAPLGALDAALDVTGSETTPPSADAIAAWCLAAGEAARTSSEGSQFQAHSYLLAAFRNAELSSQPELSAKAAFRLGLVHAVETASAGARGAASLPPGLAGGPAREDRRACAALAERDAVGMRGRALSGLALECAASRASSAGDFALSSLSSLRLARLAIAGGQRDLLAPGELGAVAQSALAAVRTADAIPDGALRAQVIGRLADTALDAGSQDRAALTGAIAAMRRAGGEEPGVAAHAAALEARLALAGGDRAGAAALAQQAVFLEAQRPMAWRLADWLLLLADAEPQRRVEHVQAAYQALETVRPFLPAEDALTRESSFALRMQKVYEAAVAARFDAATADDPAAILAAQQVVEAYRQAEIQNLFGSDCAPAPTPFAPADLRADEVVLYPVVLADRIELLYASGAEQQDGRRRFHRLEPQRGAGRAEVQRLVADMATLSRYDHDSAWRAASRRLYDLVIAPVESRLGPGTTLIVVPDAGLRTVPFAALLDSGDRFLVERSAVTVAPALAYLQPGAQALGRRPSVIAASLAQEVTLPAGIFPKLDNTVAEARTVTGAQSNGTGQGRVIENFRKADLEAALSQDRVDVLHLATHAAFNGRSDRSFIVASDQLILLSQLRDLIAARRTRGSELALLVLSACETAVGDDQAAMGLAGAAVQAGAVSALASYWQVDDVGTSRLMKVFYEGLRQGKSKSQALRAAQAQMIAGGGREADPWIWAAFSMLGGWR